MAISDEDKAKAVALKNQGNDAFKAHDYITAVEFYGKAIEIDDSEPTYFANRAQVGPQPNTRKTSTIIGDRVTDRIIFPNGRLISRQRHMDMRSKMRPRRSS